MLQRWAQPTVRLQPPEIWCAVVAGGSLHGQVLLCIDRCYVLYEVCLWHDSETFGAGAMLSVFRGTSAAPAR
jgi:hypothetical protein